MTHGELFISTDGLEPSLRDDYWREITRPIFDTSPIRDGPCTHLAGTLSSRPYGKLLLGQTSFNQQQYLRDRRIILQSGLDQYIVQLLVSGTICGEFDGADVRAEPGDICIYDLGKPLRSIVDPGERITVMLPREELERAVGWRDLHGVVLKAHQAMTRLLSDYVRGIHAVAAKLAPSQAVAVHDALLSLLVASVQGDVLPDMRRLQPLSIALHQRVVQYIEEHITERDLGPAMLMRRFRISRAHLYRVFERDGGIAKFIRDRRLDLAYRSLVDRRTSGQSIKELAYQFGFSSADMFTRAFRERFGASASEVKRERTMHSASADGVSSLHLHFSLHAMKPPRVADARD
jgi:AraC-like DNA-binding protein